MLTNLHFLKEKILLKQKSDPDLFFSMIIQFEFWWYLVKSEPEA